MAARLIFKGITYTYTIKDGVIRNHIIERDEALSDIYNDGIPEDVLAEINESIISHLDDIFGEDGIPDLDSIFGEDDF